MTPFEKNHQNREKNHRTYKDTITRITERRSHLSSITWGNSTKKSPGTREKSTVGAATALDYIIEKLPVIKENFEKSDATATLEAFLTIIDCLKVWRPSATFFKSIFLNSLAELVKGVRPHFQYIVSYSGEFFAGGTHESIKKYVTGGRARYAGNISLRGVKEGKFYFVVDEGSTSSGLALGRKAPAPIDLTTNMNRYIPPELRKMVEFIPVSGTNAITTRQYSA